MIYWLQWKCFLMLDPNEVNKFSENKKAVENRVKIVVRAAMEIMVGLVLY